MFAFTRCGIARLVVWLVLMSSGLIDMTRAQEATPPVKTPPVPVGTFPTPTAPAETGSPPSGSATSAKLLSELPQKFLDAQESAKKLLEGIEKDESLDPAIRDQVLQAYRSALETATRGLADLKSAQEDREASEQVATESARLDMEIKSLPDRFDLEVNEKSDLKAIEQALGQADADLRTFEANRGRIEQISSQRSLDRRLLLEKQATLATRRKETQEQLAPQADTTAISPLQRANQFLARVQLDALIAEEEMLRERINRFELEKNSRLTNLSLELWTLKRTLQARKVEALQQLAARKRRDETEDLLQELKQESARTFPILQSHISEIEQYAERIRTLVDQTDQAQTQLNAVREILESVSNEKRDTEAKDTSDAGKSEAFALSLLRQLYELPDVDQYREQAAQHRAQMSDATFQQIELRSLSRRLINMERVIEESIAKIQQQLGEEDLGFFEQGLRSNLRKLMTQKRESIEKLESAYNDHLDVLTSLLTAEAMLVNTVDEYHNFIHKRIFWIRSEKGLQISDIGGLLQLDAWMFGPAELTELGQAFLADAWRNDLVNLLGLAAWLLLVLLRYQAGKELVTIADQARKTNTNRILPTLRAILLTLIIATPGPLLMIFVGWRLGQSGNPSNTLAAFSTTTIQVGLIYAAMEFLRQLCRRDGVVDAHFNGPELLSTRFRRDFFLLLVVLLPLFFVITYLNHSSGTQHRLPQERILFCVGMLICTLFSQRSFSPRAPLVREICQLKSTNPIARSRWIWYPIATLAPLLLAAMAWLGYYYTATQLAWRLLLTLLLLCGILFLWGLGLRWYRMAQRWFRMYVLRERLRQPIEESHTIDGQRLKLETDSRVQDEDRERQTLKLINYGVLIPLLLGLGMIWADVLPAVSRLDEVEVWHAYVQQMDEADGEAKMRTVKQVISPLDVLLSMFVVVMTIFLSRNMPGMVDFALLQRLGIDPSLRYALTSVTGYLLTFLGLSYAFGQLGFRWEQIQWLAAALTFGLSFGLQEIFANFVSGLIILFERPVRIGDVVTIEGVTGVVTRIRIRASTITDWDHKEFLVPNKELVTGRVLNWTLSDKINRIVIPVGVAYGTDTDRVREILLEIARNDPEVVADPAPVAVMEGFGDSALNFVLRAFLYNLDKRLETIHRLHTLIHKRFLAEGIEIAFPQQDLHLRSVPPGWQQLAAERPQANSTPPPHAEITTADGNPATENSLN